MPTIIENRKVSASAAASSFLPQMRQHESELRRRNLLRLLGGGSILVAILLTILGISVHFAPAVGRSRSDTTSIVLAGYALLLIVTMPIAMFTRKESRADTANRVLDSSNHSVHSAKELWLRPVVAVAMIGALYGEYMIIDSIKDGWLRFRLREVDHYRAAAILGTISTDPRGIDPTQLLRQGEDPSSLRKVLAWLIANEWVDISPDGHYLNLLSSAKRALRRES